MLTIAMRPSAIRRFISGVESLVETIRDSRKMKLSTTSISSLSVFMCTLFAASGGDDLRLAHTQGEADLLALCLELEY